MKELTCIICPRGCHLTVDDNLNVTGNTCPRGAMYAKEELTCPKRTITTTVRVTNRDNCVTSVKTSCSIPKEMIFEIMKIINNIKVKAPIHVGDIVAKNVLNTGADIIITKNID